MIHENNGAIIIFPMEETKLSKTSSGKEPNIIDPTPLYQLCQSQLIKLNEQLAHFISCERNAKLNCIIPSISTLNQEITQIQQNINHEITQEESTNQKQVLLQKKQNLLKNIQLHSNKIEKYKKQLLMLNINHEELMREFEQNKRTIEEKQLNFCQLEPQSSKENVSTVSDTKKTVLPSLFSHKQRLETKRSEMSEVHVEKGSKWSKIDRTFDKLANLQFNNLSKILVDAAKKENGTIKGVFRNYKTNEKISEYVKSQEVRKELESLLRPKRK